MATLSPFIVKAATAALFCGGLCGLAGVVATTGRLGFLGVSLSHAAFAGALAAMLFDFSPQVGALAAALLASAVIGPLSDRGRFGPDTAVGIVFSSTLGLAFLFMGLIPGPKTEALQLFWGSLLTVRGNDVLLLGGAFVASLTAVIAFRREIQAVLCLRREAEAAGMPAAAIHHALIFFCGLVVTLCLSAVGGVLIHSLIVIPAAAASRLTIRFGKLVFLSTLFAIASAELGLALSWWLDVPVGSMIVLVSLGVFLVCMFVGDKRAQR